MLEKTDGGLHPSAPFVLAREAWTALLCGKQGDFSGCGEATLDQWTAELVAGLSGRPGEVASIRRELRKRNVAGFGMLD
jgi:hypothetical protein